MRSLRSPARLLAALFIAISVPLAAHGQGIATRATDQQALNVLNRVAYGPRPGDMEKVEAIGIDRYLERQLAPESIPESPALTRRLEALTTLRMTPAALFERYEPHAILGRRPSPEEARALRQEARIIVRQAIEARLLRAVFSERRLQEVMTDFWFNHFNVFAGKGLDRLWVGAFEEQAIRPHALGRFRDLLEATAKHPAMLFYLDNWQNTAPGSPGARKKEQGLNENYAREVMELHTLGVDGGYTQDDVIALARIFTGWGLPPGLRLARSDANGFYFDPRRHDNGTKTFLGHTIAGSGMAEGEQALDILARSPHTAHHLAFELAQYFVADQPDPALVNALAQTYSATDGDIRAVLRTLFASPQFRDSANGKFKTPYEYVVSAVRLADIDVKDVRPMAGMLAQLGMPLYGCQTPDGYKNTRDAWLNADGMTRRLNFATALGAGRTRIGIAERPDAATIAPGANAPPLLGMAMQADEGPQPLNADRLIAAFDGRLSPKTLKAVAAAPPQLRAGLLLGSPEFMNR
jgi:uncharacterized protein (DUF1800 family)